MPPTLLDAKGITDVDKRREKEKGLSRQWGTSSGARLPLFLAVT